MIIAPRLELRQSQSLVMTPQLLQAIKLLQLSSVDLTSYINNEVEQNPLLQRETELEDGTRGEANQEDNPDHYQTTQEAGDMFENGDWISGTLNANPHDIAAQFDTETENVFPDDNGSAGIEAASVIHRQSHQHPSSPSVSDNATHNLEAFMAEDIKLADHLMAQIGCVVTNPTQTLIARTLIDSIDESGYIRADLEEIANGLGTSLQKVETTLKILQTLDPSGICARNLSECLALQLKELNRFDPAIATLLKHLNLLARGDFKSLRELCGVDQDDLLDMIAEIRALDPKPGEAFESVLTQTITPDMTVQAQPDGTWAIELNPEALPRVLIDQTYYARIVKRANKEAEKAYLNDCFQSASWLVKSLDQRAKTILKVATEIVRQQDAFLTKGVEYLKPLTLKMVAEAIDMHESTISRVTANKFMITPRGIFELKYFFTAAIASCEGGQAHSAEAVRYKIKGLIDAEDPRKILSDDTLVKLLQQQGIGIARRTVAKYRDAMRIPSSVQRRREKIELIAS